jgi:hypothetical protein
LFSCPLWSGHYSGLLNSIYANGGLTLAVFEEPDAALTITGLFLAAVSLKVRPHLYTTRRLGVYEGCIYMGVLRVYEGCVRGVLGVD